MKAVLEVRTCRAIVRIAKRYAELDSAKEIKTKTKRFCKHRSQKKTREVRLLPSKERVQINSNLGLATD